MQESLAHEIILLPFHVADALIGYLLRTDATLGFRVRRRALTSGSCCYDLYIDKTRFGWFELIALAREMTWLRIYQTIFRATDHAGDDKVATACRMLFDMLAHGLQDIADRVKDPTESSLAEIALTGLITRQLQDIRQHLAILAPAPPHTPQPGDSIDTWLDWRDAEHKDGRRHTLAAIAEQGGFSLSTLKKKASARPRRKK